MTTLIETESTHDTRDIAPDDRQIALFLDFDGTLVEIAPSPEDVKLDRRVAPALEELLPLRDARIEADDDVERLAVARRLLEELGDGGDRAMW